jgi:tetratricopeptide (TPR) repeat protein
MNEFLTHRSRPLTAFLLSLGLFAGCGERGEPGSDTAQADSPAAIGSPHEAAVHLRVLYFRKDHNKAAEQGDALLARFPDAAELHAWHLLSVSRSGEGERATILAREGIERRPDDAWSHFALGAALMWNGVGDAEEALAASEAALSHNPSHPDFVWLRAESLRLSGDKENAIAFIDERPELRDTTPELLNVRAATLFDLSLDDPSDEEKRAAALEAFARSRELAPDNVIAWHGPGWFLLAQGRAAEAFPLVEKAAELSDAAMVQGSYWHAIVERLDLTQDEKREMLDASIRRVLDSPGVDVGALERAAFFYGRLELDERRRAVEDRILAEAPNSATAERVQLYRIFEMPAGTDEDDARRRDALRLYLARDQHHSARDRSTAQRMLFELVSDDDTFDAKELLDLVQDMADTGGPGGWAVAHSDGAAALASRGVYLEEAEALAKTGLEEVREFVAAVRRNVPGMDQRPNPTGRYEAAMHDALGWVYFQTDRTDEAERELLAAYELDKERPSLLLHLAALYEARNDVRRAEDYLIECAALPMNETHPCAKVLEEFYVRQNSSLDGFDAYLAGLHERLLEAGKSRVAENRLPQPEPLLPFSLETLDGDTVSLADLEGRYTVIKFWAVWCGPCRAEMPAMAEFAGRFRDSDDVRVLTVNVDPNPDTARHWLEENELDIEVLIDDGYSRQVGIVGLPTTWFLDEEGHKVFEVLGMIRDLENEYVTRLDMLRSAGDQPIADASTR